MKNKAQNNAINIITISSNWLLLVLVSVFAAGCHSPTNPKKKLKVDHNIPPSSAYDASYGFWGPEGKTIYYTHSKKLGSNPDPGQLDQLWKLDLATGQRQMIHTGRILNADISPDGNWIVFHSFALPQYLYKMRSDGTKLQKLTGPGSPNPDWKHTGLGRWSPNGNKILFTVNAGVPRGIALMDSSGSNPQITISFGVDGKWFPSGNKIVYLNWDTTQVRTKQEQIDIAYADGSKPQKITDISHTGYIGDIAEPAISPDGQSIAFTNRGKNGADREIFTIHIDGSGIEQITQGPGYAGRPEWSPDGQTILFSRIIPNVSKRLYYLNVATHQVTPVFPALKESNS